MSASSFISGLLISKGNYLVPFILTCAGYVVTAILLYYYFKDKAAGDVTGQTVGDVWYVVSPAGDKITTAP